MKFTETVNNEAIDLPVLSLSDYEQIESRVRAVNKAALRAWLDECEIKGADRFVALKNANVEQVLPANVYDFLRTTDGAQLAIKLSAKKAGLSDDKPAALYAALDAPDAFNLALALVRFDERREVKSTPPPAQS